jgi:tetratricopeptide (TPR) repeat protein
MIPTSPALMTSSDQERMHDALMLQEEAKMLQNNNATNDDDDDDDENRCSQTTQSLYQSALSIQESIVGFYHEDTARTYHQMGWLAYTSQNYHRALSYLLQSLKISYFLHGENHPATIFLLDDVQDLLEDMNLETEYANQIFESWTIQEEADDLLHENDNNDYGALELYEKALELLPLDMELERAHVYCQIASILRRDRQAEQALSFYCQALMIFPKWLPSTHIRIVNTRKASYEVGTEVTPIGKANLKRKSSWRQRSVTRQGSIQTSE